MSFVCFRRALNGQDEGRDEFSFRSFGHAIDSAATPGKLERSGSGFASEATEEQESRSGFASEATGEERSCSGFAFEALGKELELLGLRL